MLFVLDRGRFQIGASAAWALFGSGDDLDFIDVGRFFTVPSAMAERRALFLRDGDNGEVFLFSFSTVILVASLPKLEF